MSLRRDAESVKFPMIIIRSAVLISTLQMLLNVFISFFQALFQEVYLRKSDYVTKR